LTRTVNRSGARLGWLDYLLTAIGSVLAIYSAGMSIDTPEIGFFCAGLIVLGTLCSYTVKVFAGSSKLVRLDGPMYAIAAIGAIYFAAPLMGLLPVGGFPSQLSAAGGLCWMLVFGSFLSWGDGTLLFQAVPGIALFGLVGCYDTYRNVIFAFFGFLICLCTGFARAHGREMLRQAAESGYFDRAGIRFDPNAPEQSTELFDTIRKGPWRWVAGPEWALLSAMAVVLISLLGAPVIQMSVQGVAGFASIRLPNTRRNGPTSATVSQELSGSTMVGQGPVAGLTKQPVYEAKLDHVRYLRSHVYIDYTGKGWSGHAGLPPDYIGSLDEFTLTQLMDPSKVTFSEAARVVTRTFALPGEFDPSDVTDAHLQATPEGTYVSSEPIELGRFISGTSLEARDPSTSSTAIHPTPTILEPFLSTQFADQSVLDAALSVTRDCKTDRARADAIMRWIVSQAQYNANIAPTPEGSDPVAYFLFESHQGYCDLFASSMTLMARAAGIPARFVSGYLPDEQTSIDGNYIVRDTDYHDWSELFFKDVGWVVYDPTSLATVVKGGEVQIKNPNTAAFSALGWVINVAIAGFVGSAIWLIWRGRKRPAVVEESRRSEVDEIYVSFARTLRSFTGRRRLLSETPSEYLSQTRFALNGAFEKAEGITRKFEGALYAPGRVTDETLAELRSDLRELKKMLRAEKKAAKSRPKAPTPEESTSP
jgi:transglutaminase-like putative cysteine protease